MGLFDTVLDVIDARSFSSIWYWLVVATAWSVASHRVVGVPWDVIARAERLRGEAEDDLHAVLRIHVLRLLRAVDAAGLWMLGLGTAALTSLALLGFLYWVEMAQALFLLALPMGVVALMTVGAARDLAAGRAPEERLYVRLRRHRLGVQAIGAASIFVTALWGMYQNLVLTL